MIRNPILRGFHPDPSIVRVEDEYFIATSTFEWFPGVRIYKSTDLATWELAARPLDRVSQLDMRGVPDSCGIWAPCLSHDGDLFWLVYSNVKSFDGVWKDTPNYLVTAPTINGPWSEPIYLGSHGFDGSMFHDEDGRHWFLSMLVDHRKGKFFGGIVLQEYDHQQQSLIGPVHHIFEGTSLERTEGPHLYQRDGYYYLLTAEGGTDYDHAVTIARSPSIFGPYEVHPENPILTTSHDPEHPLQRTGHGDLVMNQDGSWHIVFLTGRPITEKRRCILGRETAIEEIDWPEGDWPRLTTGDKRPRLTLSQGDPDSPSQKINQSIIYRFSQRGVHPDFQSLRIPIEEAWCSVHARPGYLRLYGRDSLSSFQRQSLVARRVSHFQMEAVVCLEFQPSSFQEMAGLVCYYNTAHYHYLAVSGDEKSGGRTIQIISSVTHEVSESSLMDIEAEGPVFLKAVWNRESITFYVSTHENAWTQVGHPVDGTILSDDFVRDSGKSYRPAFTGSFVGICCQDLRFQKGYGDFKWMRYRGKDEGLLP